MFKYLIGLIIIFISIPSFLAASTLMVYAQGFDSNQGKALIMLYDSPEGFPDDKPFKLIHVPIKNKKAHCQFKDLNQGTYAVVVIHDTNDNSKMDKDFFDFPSEEYGISNQVKEGLNKPKFTAAAINLKKNERKIITIDITN